MITKYLIVFLISMVPLIELRGAIPYAVAFHIPTLPAYLIAVIGNMLPVPIIFLFARKVLVWGCDKKYIGKVIKISHLATTNEKGSTLISATVSIDQPDEDIFLGVDAKVKIYAEKAEDVVTLPAGVVNIGKAGSFCYVLKDGVITKQDITTGISSEDVVEVTDGIKAGDEVIEDLGSLEEGMTAEAAPAEGDSAAATGETADE